MPASDKLTITPALLSTQQVTAYLNCSRSFLLGCLVKQRRLTGYKLAGPNSKTYYKRSELDQLIADLPIAEGQRA